MSSTSLSSRVAAEILSRVIAQAPNKALSLLIDGVSVRVEVQALLFRMLADHLDLVGTCLGSVPKKYWLGGTERDVDGGVKNTITLTYSHRLYLVKQKPFLLSFQENPDRYFITYSRGFDIDALLAVVASQKVFTTERAMLSCTVNPVSVDTVSYLKPVQVFWKSPAYLALEQDFCAWFAAKEKLARLNLPWRRGWLLHGSPGNGKTFALRTLASNHGLALAQLNLNITDTDFIALWGKLKTYAPVLIVIEDIDDVIQGRVNVRDPERGVAFSTLLNAIDGIDSAHGIIVAITTNKVDVIDSALGRPRDEAQWNQLSTRPGRLDRCVRFDNPDLGGRLAIARMFLPESQARQLALAHTDLSTVQFQSLCREAAFAEHQDLGSVG